MRLTGAVAFACLLGFASNSYAGENEKPNKIEDLTTTQLGDYSLKLETDQPASSNAPVPLGLLPSKQDAINPFVGLKLSKPLPNDFLSLGK